LLSGVFGIGKFFWSGFAGVEFEIDSGKDLGVFFQRILGALPSRIIIKNHVSKCFLFKPKL
jgi:hypothetical protein